MTSAQRSDSVPRPRETEAGPQSSLTRIKESVSSVHAAQLANHTAYAVLVEIAQGTRRHHPSKLAKQAAYSLLPEDQQQHQNSPCQAQRLLVYHAA